MSIEFAPQFGATHGPSPGSSVWLPPLQSGDRLTRAEFERRYELMPEKVKAELIEGVVYIMSSPVSAEGHGSPHAKIVTWLGMYSGQTPGTEVADNSTIRLDEDNEPQPDALLRIHESYGGQSRIVDRGFLEGPPELIAEVSSSTASYDLHDKLNAYRRNRVQEYLVWRVWDKAVDWFIWSEGRYEPLLPDARGWYQSRVFPGLWLDAAALLAGDMKQVFDVLQQGLASPEHAEFLKRMAGGRPSP